MSSQMLTKVVNCIRFLSQVRCKKFDESVVTLERSLNVMHTLGGNNAAAGRSAAGLVMVQLVKEDNVAASKAFEAWGNYCDSETFTVLKSLLEAFDDQDGDAAKEAINSKAIRDFDIDFARLAKSIVLPDSAGLEAAAAKLGAERAAVAEKEKAAAIAAKAATSSIAPPEVVAQEERSLEQEKSHDHEDDEEDDLC